MADFSVQRFKRFLSKCFGGNVKTKHNSKPTFAETFTKHLGKSLQLKCIQIECSLFSGILKNLQ